MTSNDLHVNSAKSSRTMICRWSWSHSSGLRRFNMDRCWPDGPTKQCTKAAQRAMTWTLAARIFLHLRCQWPKRDTFRVKKLMLSPESHVLHLISEPLSPKRGRVIHGGHSKHRPISGWIYQGEFTAWRSTGEYHLLRPRDRKTSAHLRDFQKS